MNPRRSGTRPERFGAGNRAAATVTVRSRREDSGGDGDANATCARPTAICSSRSPAPGPRPPARILRVEVTEMLVDWRAASWLWET